MMPDTARSLYSGQAGEICGAPSRVEKGKVDIRLRSADKRWSSPHLGTGIPVKQVRGMSSDLV